MASKKIVTATSKGKTKEYMIKPARNVPKPKTSKKIGTSTTGKLTTSKLATQKGQRNCGQIQGSSDSDSAETKDNPALMAAKAETKDHA